MLGKLRPHLTYANVMVTLMAIAIIGGGSVAIGGVINEDGEIKACFDKKGKNRGDLRLLVKGRCTRQERKILWNQKGSPGDPGQPGEQGPPGGPATGPAGGDLTGSYPDPRIGESAVLTDNLADGAVTGPKIADDSVGPGDIAGVSELAASQALTLETGQTDRILETSLATIEASCVEFAGDAVAQLSLRVKRDGSFVGRDSGGASGPHNVGATPFLFETTSTGGTPSYGQHGFVVWTPAGAATHGYAGAWADLGGNPDCTFIAAALG